MTMFRPVLIVVTTFVCLSFSRGAVAQTPDPSVSEVWVSDLRNGMYQNPVLHADYSDPDACRVEGDFYMVASSFNAVPGLPLLHSRDLVNWRLIGHALRRQPPFRHYSHVQHGNGVWAPSIRFHEGEFYIYYPDPDFGIYLVKSKKPEGPWSEPILVEGGKGLIDPCPLWDDDGSAYLVYAYAGSRAGIKSILAAKRMSKDGTRTLDEGRIVYDGHRDDPTVEGPKFYKRNGYYYIFAPAGGVSTGWQIVLRSRNVWGPYERKVVMHQGKTKINGPHQGAWVTTPAGEDWFLHFQDKDAYGRIVHLQPMTWKNDWPVIGEDKDGDGIGEPVIRHRKPEAPAQTIAIPPDTDEFSGSDLGLQWQWAANPQATWSFIQNGTLRLYSQAVPDSAKNLWLVPNLLLQKFPAPAFTATAKLTFTPNAKLTNERAGIVVMGMAYGALSLRSTGNGLELVLSTCEEAEKGEPEKERVVSKVSTNEVFLKVSVGSDATYAFSYSLEGQKWITLPEKLKAQPGKWIGSKVGLFCIRTSKTNDSGYADMDWFRVTPK